MDEDPPDKLDAGRHLRYEQPRDMFLGAAHDAHDERGPRATLTELPTENLLDIMLHLSVLDILSLRQVRVALTCSIAADHRVDLPTP